MKKKMKKTGFKTFITAAVLIICLLMSAISLAEVRKTEAAVLELADTVSEFADYTRQTLTVLDERLSALEAEVYK